MTAQQVKNLNDLMTDTLVKGYTTEISITQYHKYKQAHGFVARMRPNLEKPVTVFEEFLGATPLEAYSKLADAMAKVAK